NDIGGGWVGAFLYFGYVPDPEMSLPAHLAIEECDVPDVQTDLVEAADQILDHAVVHYLKKCGGRATHLVPLSGGIDSRILLGALLRHVSPREIRTVTFGTPGAWDYD